MNELLQIGWREIQRGLTRYTLLLLTLLCLAGTSYAQEASTATVTSDKDDYAPGEYVLVTGTGWEPGETVSLDFHESPKVCLSDHHERSTIADANGNIHYDQYLINVKHIGVSFILTAHGLSSDLTAQTYFTDANVRFDASGLEKFSHTIIATYEVFSLDAQGNYTKSIAKGNKSFSYPGPSSEPHIAVKQNEKIVFSFNDAISPSGVVYKALGNEWISGTNGQNVYTARANYVQASKADPVVSWGNPQNITFGTALDGLQLNATANIAGTFSYTPNAGTILNAGVDQTLSVTFIPTNSANYNPVTRTVTITVEKADQIISWSTPSNITYGTTLDEVQLNAIVTFGGGALIYSPAKSTLLDAGSHILTVTAAETSNYKPSSKTVSINVDKANAILKVTGYTGIYDGLIHGASGSAKGVNNEDLSDLLNLGANFINYPGGTVHWTFSGNDNYYTASNSVPINIEKRPITVTPLPDQRKIYGQEDPIFAYDASEELLTGNSFIGAIAREEGSNVGEYAFTLGTLSAGDNYTVSLAGTAKFSITPAAITATLSAEDKVYDATDLAVAYASASGVNGAAVPVAVTNAKFASANAGTWPVTANVAISDPNYQLSSVTAYTAAKITPKQLTASIVAQDKVYDGTTAASATGSVSAAEVIAGDVVEVAVTGAAFDDKHVGEGKTVSAGVSISNSNYSLSALSASTTANITAKPITGTFASANKVYDGNTSAAASDRTLVGTIAGDDVYLSEGSAAFADPNAGTGKTVRLTGAGLSGDDKGNYALTSVATTTADITPLGISGTFASANKIYDGNTDAQAGNLALLGVLLNDEVYLMGGSAKFAHKNVGTNIVVTLSGATLSGAEAGNYLLTSVAPTSANILAKPLTPAITAANKEYDGNTLATLTSQRVVGTVGTEVVDLLVAAAHFDTKHAGTDKTVTATGLSLSGDAASNYELAVSAATTAANITPRALLVSARGIDKVYDGNTNAGVTLLDNRLPNDVLSTAYATANFSDKNVGNAIVVNVSGISISGADAGNYTANATAVTSANITPKSLTITAPSMNKYCGAADPTNGVCSVVGAIAGETIATGYRIDGTSIIPTTTALQELPLSNYQVSLVAGTLTINNISLELTNANLPRSNAQSFQIEVAVKDGSRLITEVGVQVVLYIKGAEAGRVTSINGIAQFPIAPISAVGVYEVRAAAGNNCSTAEASYLPIYDPTAGFVTGGGWILSPNNAHYTEEETPSEIISTRGKKGHFAFVSKYEKGAKIPSGNTQFRIEVGSLEFTSTEYEWLVVSGSTAKYKGKGNYNGKAGYGFLLYSTDGDLKSVKTGDTFRIKIWNMGTGAVVYDNERYVSEEVDASSQIASGSIVIHQPNTKGTTAKAAREIEEETAPDFAISSISAYPNPLKEQLFVELPALEAQAVRMVIYTLDGRIMTQKQVQTNGTALRVVLSSSFEQWPSGIYLLKVEAEGTQKIIKLLK